MAYSLLVHTSRLTIVGINEIDIAQLIDYFQTNFEHLRFGGGFVPRTEQQIYGVYDNWLDSIESNDEVRFFILKDDQLIGIIGLSNIVRGAFHAAYIGYHLAENEQSNGYMTEALSVVIEFAFTALNLHRLMANYRPDNTASANVLSKLNFQKEGLAKNYLLVDDTWCDHVLTSLTNPNWQQPT